MADNKEVVFVTRYKGLELVHTSMGLKDPQGNKVPSKRCLFTPTQYGYAYKTSDPVMVKWLDEHEYMKRGEINRFDPATVTLMEEPKVSNKGVTTVSGKAQVLTPAPSDAQGKPHRATVRK